MLRLLLPALMPSWRFFDTIGPSPRLEFAVLQTADESPKDWQRFRAKPAVVPAWDSIRRIFWDPGGNETLYLMACCERVLQSGSAHAQRELRASIVRELAAAGAPPAFLTFRILLGERQGEGIVEWVAFQSRVEPVGVAR